MVHVATKFLSTLTVISLIVTTYTTFSMNKTMIEWEIIYTSNTSLNIPILLDPTSMLFTSTVLLIASSVMQFAKTYMINDKFSDRFIILVLMFVSSMIMLILLPHTMFLLLGWDGLGITSFILVIYYNNPKSLGAGMITAMTNRIGDVMMLMTIALMLNESNWLTMNQWMNNKFTIIAAMMVLIAAMTKSAQMPFSSWLPAAMAAPTPVSALVHSSTLVTAGVYLIYRFFPLMEKWSSFKPVLLIISTMTMLMASASAMAECDMKKIIALSTLSQVAMMMFTLSLGLPEIAFFHLITHALFKALLFICAGNMIDIHHHSQDLRLMGNLSNQLPISTTSILIANMALCGMPFLSGFYSKDLIIESSSMMMMKKNTVIMILFIIATTMTTAYSSRMTIHMILSPTQSQPSQYINEKESHTMSTMSLSLMAIMGGSTMNWIFISPIMEPNFSSIFKYMAPIMMLSGLVMGLSSYYYAYPMLNPLIQMNCSMWFSSPLSSHLSPNALMKLPILELKENDQGWSFIPFTLYAQSTFTSFYMIKSQHSLTTKSMLCISIIMLWLSLSMM
uniref:NADH-ubiquinone oxidoreductase chain 5 n=1 Tax=Nereis sp. TaxID=61854 RepID=A0A345WJQ7_9ANNE|nr:NADH dehydrogenase subunit 5 [Nereis sp.]